MIAFKKPLLVLSCTSALAICALTAPTVADIASDKNSSSATKPEPETAHTSITLNQERISALENKVTDISSALTDLEESLRDEHKEQPDIQKAIDELQTIQKRRQSTISGWKATDKISQNEAQALQQGDEINTLIKTLPTEPKAEKEALISALKGFAQEVDRLSGKQQNTPSISLPSLDDREEEANSEEEHTADQALSLETQKKHLKETHAKMQHHLEEMSDHLRNLSELLEKKGDEAQSEHHQALEAIKELHENHSKIFTTAQEEQRPLTEAEAHSIRAGETTLHASLALLPSTTPEEVALKNTIIDEHSGLFEGADALAALHAADTLGTSH